MVRAEVDARKPAAADRSLGADCESARKSRSGKPFACWSRPIRHVISMLNAKSAVLQPPLDKRKELVLQVADAVLALPTVDIFQGRRRRRSDLLGMAKACK